MTLCPDLVLESHGDLGDVDAAVTFMLRLFTVSTDEGVTRHTHEPQLLFRVLPTQ